MEIKKPKIHYLIYILIYLISTRIILELIGVWSRITRNNHFSWNYFLDIWKVWDSQWYIKLAQWGYACSFYGPYESAKNLIAFFPLYHNLIRFFHFVFIDYTFSAIIVSNMFLIIAGIFLYKLMKSESDESTSLRSIKYLMIFPLSFVLSGVFTESLFLALLIICFYYANKGKWLITGIFGFLLALTKPQGSMMLIPLAVEYLSIKKYDLKKIKPDILFLLLIPLGLIFVMLMNYYLTGNCFAFLDVQKTAWGHNTTNPILFLYNTLLYSSFENKLLSIYTIFIIFFLILFYKKIKLSYIIIGLIIMVFPLTSGSVYSNMRYSVLVFPIYIILAKTLKSRFIDILMTIIFLILQIYLMSIWVGWSRLII